MPRAADPATTYAIVVGIEKYAGGKDWNLNGPASDACRMALWLRKNGVPADRIAFHLSPLDPEPVAPGPAIIDPNRLETREDLIARCVASGLRVRDAGRDT